MKGGGGLDSIEEGAGASMWPAAHVAMVTDRVHIQALAVAWYGMPVLANASHWCSFGSDTQARSWVCRLCRIHIFHHSYIFVQQTLCVGLHIYPCDSRLRPGSSSSYIFVVCTYCQVRVHLELRLTICDGYLRR